MWQGASGASFVAGAGIPLGEGVLTHPSQSQGSMTTISARSAPGVTTPSARPHRAIRNPARRGPIVLATDGTGVGGAPVLAAQLLAARLDLPVEIVTVLEPVPLYNGALDMGMSYNPVVDEMRRDARETEVSDWVARFSGGAAPSRVHVRHGSVAYEIARFAREISATVVVMGAAPHRRLRHVVAGERAAQVLRSGDCPVLSVPLTFSGLPKVALVAVDFGPSSVRAALTALLMLDDCGTLVLTHVLPPLMSPAALSTPPSDDPTAEVHALFDRLRTELDPYVPNGVKVETRLVTDDPVDGVLKSAEHLDADLVAVGTRGPGMFTRLLIGSVAASLIHADERPVLATPPPGPADALELWRRVCGVATSDRAQEWSAALDAFSRRNAGRDTLLEVREPDRGARVASHGYALVGVTYEPAERQVEIMLGDADRPSRHLTRSIRHPDAITLTAASAGRGETLDIRHGHGHTILALSSPGAPGA